MSVVRRGRKRINTRLPLTSGAEGRMITPGHDDRQQQPTSERMPDNIGTEIGSSPEAIGAEIRQVENLEEWVLRSDATQLM